MPTLVAFGNSHLWPFVRGHRLLHAQGEIDYDMHALDVHGGPCAPYFENKGGRFVFNPLAIEAIRAAVAEYRPDCLVTAILGSEGWRDGMMRAEYPYDVIVPELPQHAMSPNATLMLYDLFVLRIFHAVNWQFGIIDEIRKFCDLPIFHVEAPPPVESEAMMLRSVYGHFKEGMEKFGLPTVSYRFKQWWGWSKVTKDICARLGIHFIEGPPETRDKNGFLDEQYFADGVHGTDAYGGLVAREISAAMRRLGIMRG